MTPDDFGPGDVVVSLGCGGGAWEIGWMYRKDSLACYLVDIDAGLLNEAEVAAGIGYWERQGNGPALARFIPVIGTEHGVPLSDGYADKVLILNALHEFDFPDDMLSEARRLLKPGGCLYIQEEESRFPGEKHEGCGRELFSLPDLIQKVRAKGFSGDLISRTPDSRACLLTFYAC